MVARTSRPETWSADAVANSGDNLTDQPSVGTAGNTAYGPGVGGASGTSGVRNGPLPPTQFPAGQSPTSPHTALICGNVGNGRASQFHADMNAVWIIGTPPLEVTLLPSVTQYS